LLLIIHSLDVLVCLLTFFHLSVSIFVCLSVCCKCCSHILHCVPKKHPQHFRW